jgi:hypothetical protein
MLLMITGVIVVHLVIIPRHHPRGGCVGRLQIRVTLVQRIAVPVVLERGDLGAVVLARLLGPDAPFVDVVAEVHDQIHRFLRQMPMRRVVAGLIVLTGGKRERHIRRDATTLRRRTGPADGTRLATGDDAIPVVARRLEAIHFDMDGMPHR